jgi:hypothetical protein
MSNATCDVSVTSDVVLVCIGSDALRRRITATLRAQWPVRTACDDWSVAESLDESVSVVVFDLDDGTFEVDGALDQRSQGSISFETAALVDDPSHWSDERLDGYVRKPVSDDDLRATVERLNRRVQYDRLLGRYYTVASEYAEEASATHHDPSELARLKERLFTMRKRLDEIADGLENVDAFDVALGESGDEHDDDFSPR